LPKDFSSVSFLLNSVNPFAPNRIFHIIKHKNWKQTIYFECRSTIETQVIWKKDALTLKKGTAQSFLQKDREARVMVDTFSILYLKGNLKVHVYWFFKFYTNTEIYSFIYSNAWQEF